jgi:hypothetical protein
VSNVWASIGAFLLGVVGWFGSHFVGSPFRKFFDLRGEVIQQSIVYGNVMAPLKEFPDGSVRQVDVPEDELKRLREAEDVFRDLAARMRAFALSEPFALWFVEWRYDPWRASETLFGVSNTLHKYGGTRADAKKALEQALNFRITERRKKPALVRLVDSLVGKTRRNDKS